MTQGDITITRIPAPEVSLKPGHMDFENVPVGKTSEAHTLTVTNTGQASLQISNLTFSGDNASDFAMSPKSPPLPLTVAPGASVKLFVTFTPSARGTRSATLDLIDNAPDSPQYVELSGIGRGQ